MATVAVVVLASFSPAQLQSRTQIVFAPRVCTLVLFHLSSNRPEFWSGHDPIDPTGSAGPGLRTKITPNVPSPCGAERLLTRLVDANIS